MPISKNWIDGKELLERWKIREFELVEYIQQGLQPYSKHGVPI